MEHQRDELSRFVEVASDLYRANPAYRAELDAERRGEQLPADRRASTLDRLEELDWLIRNGMSAVYAIEQCGWTVDAARTAAIRWAHPVRARIVPAPDPAPSAWWAKTWLSAHGGRDAA